MSLSVVGSLRLGPETLRLPWAYVVALARHVVRCEAGRAQRIEDFAALRF